MVDEPKILRAELVYMIKPLNSNVTQWHKADSVETGSSSDNINSN